MSNYLLQIDSTNKYHENEEDLIIIRIGSEDVLKINYSKLINQSKYIRDTYKYPQASKCLQDEISNLKAKKNIKDSSIKHFFEYIQEEKISIPIDEYRDIYKLSEHFKNFRLTNELDNIREELFNDLNFLIQMLLDSTVENDELEMRLTMQVEKILSSRINECFSHPKFGELLISIVYRIIDKSDKENINNDLLLDFILESIESRFILFKFVAVQKLSNKHFEMLIDFLNEQEESSQKLYLECIPFNLSFIKQMMNEHDNLLRDFQQIKEELNIAKEEPNKTKEELNQTREEFCQTKEELNKTKDELNQIKNEYNQLKEESNKTKEELNKTKNEFNQMKMESNKTKEELNKTRKELNQSKVEFNQAKKDFNHMKEESNKTKEELNKTKKEFNQIKVELDQAKSFKNEVTKQQKFFELQKRFISNQKVQFSDLIPTGKLWKQGNNSNVFILTDNMIYEVISSSIFDSIHLSKNLFDGNNEIKDNRNVWACTQKDKDPFIQIKFSKPIVSNVISITARRDPWYTQAPKYFEVFGVCNNHQEILLGTFIEQYWNPNDKKNFCFLNDRSFPMYKVKFYKPNSTSISIAGLNFGFISL